MVLGGPTLAGTGASPNSWSRTFENSRTSALGLNGNPNPLTVNIISVIGSRAATGPVYGTAPTHFGVVGFETSMASPAFVITRPPT